MSRLSTEVQKKARTDIGSYHILSKNIVSSTITVAAQNFSQAASGRFYIEDVVFETDSVGLAGLTNICLGTNNAIGLTGAQTGTSLAETAMSTGNKTLSLQSGSDDSSTDRFLTVSGITGVLEAGKSLQFSGTGSAGTGAGIVRITVVMRRIDAGATCNLV